jgi:predicted Zn-dependent peptidase
MRFHHSILPNGLHVIAELNDRAYSVAAGFFVKSGSRDETPETWGVSHFLEHMVFKGTDRRDALTVNRDFDRFGAKHNAQTSEEETFYHVTALPEYLGSAFEVLSDILRPSLREGDFDTEKNVIIEEIKMYEDNPMSVCYDAAKDVHFGPHPLGRCILGTVESIGGMKVDAMRDYFRSKYSPANIVLGFAGNAEWSDLLALAETHCGAWTGGETAREAVAPRGTRGFRAIRRDEDLQQTMIGASDAPSLESPERYAAHLLGTVLGDHTGSRLYWGLVNPGHAEAAEAWFQDYNQAGAIFSYIGCAPDDAEANLARLDALYRQVTASGVTEAELEQAKNKVLSRTVIRSERPMGRLESLGLDWTYRRRYIPLETELEALNRVTTADVRRLLDEWPLRPMSIVSVGPTTDVKPPA